MVKIMSKVEAETGRFVPSDRLLSQEECTISKYRDPQNPQKPFFFKDLTVFYRRVPLANDTNTLLIDDSLLKSLLKYQYMSLVALLGSLTVEPFRGSRVCSAESLSRLSASLLYVYRYRY